MKSHTILLSLLPIYSSLAKGDDTNFRRHLFTGLQNIDVEYEGLFSSNRNVQRGSFSYQQKHEKWTFALSYFQTEYGLEYKPFAPLGGSDKRLEESNHQGSLSIGYTLQNNIETSVSVTSYDGFSDYRSIWIGEYYRQAFNFPGSGYFAPDPKGFSISNSWGWDPQIGTSLSIDLSYSEDTITPGWTFGSPANDLLKNRIVSVRWEQAINPSLKTETSFYYSDITDREPRLNLQSSWNYALTNEITLGAQLGGSREESDFDSFYGGLSVTYEVNDYLSLKFNGRLYSDSGEIETSGFNSAAPGINTAEIGISALIEHGDHAFQLGISSFTNNYKDTDSDNEFFTNLYDDRDWITIRAAYTFEF